MPKAADIESYGWSKVKVLWEDEKHSVIYGLHHQTDDESVITSALLSEQNLKSVGYSIGRRYSGVNDGTYGFPCVGTRCIWYITESWAVEDTLKRLVTMHEAVGNNIVTSTDHQKYIATLEAWDDLVTEIED